MAASGRGRGFVLVARQCGEAEASQAHYVTDRQTLDATDICSSLRRVARAQPGAKEDGGRFLQSYQAHDEQEPFHGLRHMAGARS